jgi:hypothetical protein
MNSFPGRMINAFTSALRECGSKGVISIFSFLEKE